jgi:hypothetical protein
MTIADINIFIKNQHTTTKLIILQMGTTHTLNTSSPENGGLLHKKLMTAEREQAFTLRRTEETRVDECLVSSNEPEEGFLVSNRGTDTEIQVTREGGEERQRLGDAFKGTEVKSDSRSTTYPHLWSLTLSVHRDRN